MTPPYSIKRTDNSYLQWLSDIETNKKHSELFVYGHSLSPADGDVLRKFISCQYIKTVVFCRNEDDRANKTANLSIVLEPDNLIKLAGGINPAIEFRLIE